MAQNTNAEQIAGQFKSGGDCARIMAVYFAGKFGEDEAEVRQFMRSFGGAMRQGDVCGAVTGGLFALTMKEGVKSGGGGPPATRIQSLSARHSGSGTVP